MGRRPGKEKQLQKKEKKGKERPVTPPALGDEVDTGSAASPGDFPADLASTAWPPGMQWPYMQPPPYYGMSPGYPPWHTGFAETMQKVLRLTAQRSKKRPLDPLPGSQGCVTSVSATPRKKQKHEAAVQPDSSTSVSVVAVVCPPTPTYDRSRMMISTPRSKPITLPTRNLYLRNRNLQVGRSYAG